MTKKTGAEVNMFENDRQVCSHLELDRLADMCGMFAHWTRD